MNDIGKILQIHKLSIAGDDILFHELAGVLLLDHAEHLTFKLSLGKVLEWEISFVAFIFTAIIAAFSAFTGWNLQVVAFLLFATTHIVALLVIVSFFSVFILLAILVVVHAFWLSLTTKHGCLHISFLLISLSLHLFQEVLSILLLEDTSCLLLLLIRLEENPTEYLGRNPLMETVGHQLSELVELFLLILGMLGLLDEPDDLLLDLFWQVKMVHSSIHRINLLLQDDGFLVDVVH